MIFTAALIMLLFENWVGHQQMPAHIILLFLWRLYSKWQK
nr:MAG TPA: hypothetical protein [Caudoviricetes sp.]